MSGGAGAYLEDAAMKLSEITPTKTPPTPGRIVLVKYEIGPGRVGTLPGIVVAGAVSTIFGHSYCNVVPFGDGIIVRLDGAGEALNDLALFDPLPAGVVPDVDPCETGAFAGHRVWCEWMPFQKLKHDAAA